MKAKYCIFDMDGVLIDSEPMYRKFLFEVFQLSDIQLSEEYIENLTGMSEKPMWEKVKADSGSEKTAEELANFYRNYIQERLPQAEVLEVEGVKNVIKLLKENGFSLSIASSSARKWIEFFTKKIGIYEYFDVISSGDDVKYSKPFPEIFLKVAQWYKISSENFWVIEDSKNGVQAAKSAGMNCIGFQSINSGNQDLAKADVIIHSMDEITQDFINEKMQ
ncbi:MAG: HAD family phosphatase [Capnocytophaga sp.]|nr:HAD family phosphatase [Capnocytophaga sp.]